MPLQAMLKAGNMQGSTADKRIPINAVYHEIKAPVNPTDGVKNLGRAHGPLVITKKIDHLSAFFHDYQTQFTPISPFELRFNHNPPSGRAANYLTIVLTDAKVIGIKSVMPRVSEQGMAFVHEYEEISFTYSKIEWREEAVKSSEGGQSFQSGQASAHDDKNAGMTFYPDWLEEQARFQSTQAIAALKKAGIDYGSKLYDDLFKKFDEEEKAKKAAEEAAPAPAPGTPPKKK